MFTAQETLTDELTGFMFKKSDSDDDNTWLESRDFHSVAAQILFYLQSKGLLHSQLQQHDVSCCKELLEDKLKKNEMLVSWNVEGSEALDERLRQNDALKIVLKMINGS